MLLAPFPSALTRDAIEALGARFEACEADRLAARDTVAVLVFGEATECRMHLREACALCVAVGLEHLLLRNRVDPRYAPDRRLIELDRTRVLLAPVDRFAQLALQRFEVAVQFVTLGVGRFHCLWRCHPAESIDSMPRRRPLDSALACLLATLSILVCASPLGCARDDARVLRLGHGLDSQHPVHLAMTSMGEDLERRSNGALRLEIYPNEQLGSERECLELLQIGSLAMTKVSAAVLENFAPSFRVFGVPYLFRDDAHRFSTLEGPIGREMLLGLSRVRLRGLTWYDAGSRSFYTRDRPVHRPEDLVGLKIRVQESPSAIAMVRAMGGAATPIAWGELYTALQQGVVDGAENNPPSFHLSRHYEASRYLSLDEHTAVPDVLLVSEAVWQRLDMDERGWLADAAAASAQYQKALWRDATANALDAVRAAGVEIIRPDKQAFAQKAAPLQHEPRIDASTAKLVTRVRAVSEANAAAEPPR